MRILRTPVERPDLVFRAPMFRKLRSFTLLWMMVFAGAGVQAAPIYWSAPRDISGDSDLSTNGLLVKAVAVSGGAYPTVNGVAFTPFPGNDSVSGTDASNYATGSLPAGGNISQNYSTLLSQNVYSSGTGSTVTLTVNGLTVGYHYELQVWMNDSNAAGQTTLTVKSPGSMDPWAQLNAGGDADLHRKRNRCEHPRANSELLPGCRSAGGGDHQREHGGIHLGAGRFPGSGGLSGDGAGHR